MATTYESVQNYYGKKVQKTEDLKTSACMTSCGSEMPKAVKEALAQCHEEVISKYYGCGPVFPEAVEGCHVLDLGSGAGRDCFILSKLVGEKGYVIGVDMTQEQLDVANKYIAYHTEKFGYSKPNVEFQHGFIECLADAGIKDHSQDVVVSNCVINLSPDKVSVLKEVYRVLKPGGEMYFSDVYSDKPVSEEARRDEVLWGECISGALQWEEWMRIASDVGFSAPMLVKVSPITVENQNLKAIVGDVKFCSATYRLFKPDDSDDCSQKDPLMEIKYKDDILASPKTFQLTWDINIGTGCPAKLPASIVASILSSRLAPHFDISPASSQAAATTKYKSAQDLLTVNPFKVLDSMEKDGVAKSCC